MKWGDVFRGYNWNILIGIIAVSLIGLSFLIPFSDFGYCLVLIGGTGLIYVLLSYLFNKKGDRV
jgi:hypothetical protein